MPKDYKELLAAFKSRLSQSEKYLIDFELRHYNGAREEAVVYCLRHGIDLAKGCLATALKELPESATTLSRACLETMFWTRYVTMSEENAQEFVTSTVNEMKRISRKNIVAGYAKVYHLETDEDRTKEILESPLLAEIPKRISIETASKAGGLERVYTMVYGPLSMIAHGRAFNLKLHQDRNRELFAAASAAVGALQCTEMISADWIIHRKQTPREILVKMLGV